MREYFNILHETLLASEVPSWKGGTSRKTVETSKFYFFDSGVVRVLSKRRETTPGTPEFGLLLETLVHHELRCYLDVHTRNGEIFYWRTPSGTEVDFIVGNSAFEVQGTSRVNTHDMKGLKSISTEGSFAHRVIVCREPLPFVKDGIEVLPYDVFVDRLWHNELITV